MVFQTEARESELCAGGSEGTVHTHMQKGLGSGWDTSRGLACETPRTLSRSGWG